jgi:hypothetical protein
MVSTAVVDVVVGGGGASVVVVVLVDVVVTPRRVVEVRAVVAVEEPGVTGAVVEDARGTVVRGGSVVVG